MTKSGLGKAAGEADERRVVAYHEAGHAVASRELQIPFKHVTIVPDEEGGSAGHILHPPTPKWLKEAVDSGDMGLRVRDRIERSAMASLAGKAATDIAGLTHLNPEGDAGDVHEAIGVLSHLVGNSEELGLYVQLLSIRVKGLLLKKWNWASVEALASALLEHHQLSARRAKAIIRQGRETVIPPLNLGPFPKLTREQLVELRNLERSLRREAADS